MLHDDSSLPPHDVVPTSKSSRDGQNVVPELRHSLSFFRMFMMLFATTVFPLVLLTSATAPQSETQVIAMRQELLQNTKKPAHGAAPVVSGTSSSAASSMAKSLIERLREKRQAAHPGVVPLKPSAPPAHADNKVATYLGAGSVRSEDFLQYTLDSIVKSGGTAFVFEVKADRVYFDTKSPMANDLKLVSKAANYDIDHVLAEAKKRGLYTIGRYVSLKDEGLYDAAPDSRVKNPKTGGTLAQGWTDGSSPTTLEYNRQIICELAGKGIDEINLDYIRFSTADFGNLHVYSGEEKAQHVKAFIQMARDAISACGPTTKLGISTFAILGWDYENNVETLGQDVKSFVGLVDIISPMAYPATFTSPEYYIPGRNPRSRMYWLVYHTLTGYKEMIGEENAYKLRPWIQGYYVDSSDMREQFDAVTDAGLCGFQVWNANGNYKSVYAALSNWSQPENCK